MTDHANTIRNGLLPRDAHHKFCNTRRDIGRECDCYYSLRRDGKVAHDALDALLAGHAAEVGRLREWVARLLASSEQEAWDEQYGPGDWQLQIKRQYQAERDEARADAETLRTENERRGYALIDVWEYDCSTHEDNCGCGLCMTVWEALPCDYRAALAAAQEPPAKGGDR